MIETPAALAGLGPQALARPALRAFVALELPDHVRLGITRLLGTLEADAACRRARVRWSGAGSLHVTLEFIGRLEQDRVPAVEAALGKVAAAHAPFDLALGGTGCFPNPTHPKVLWVGLRGDLGALGRLVADVEQGLAPLGIVAENRIFTPHLTLGRIASDGGAAEAVAAFAAAAAAADGPVLTDVMVLFRSDTRPEGAVHTPLWKGALGRGP